MKIKRLMIDNYRSLKRVQLEDLNELTIFIGINSSGKSNILEAIFLFFNEFDPSLQRSIGAIDEYIWFDRVPDDPIQFKVDLELDKAELAALLPTEVFQQIETKDQNLFEIVRTITGPPTSAIWHTPEIKVNDISLISNEKFVFQPKTKGTVGAAVSSTKTPPTDFSGAILQKLSQRLKGKFKLISAARNTPTVPTGISMRSTFLQSQILSDLTILGQPVGRPRNEERQWIKIDENFRRTCRNISDLRIMGSRVTIREKESDMYFPIEATGGGYQEMIGLICQLLKEDGVIFGVEEPELHLHPELARQFLSVVKELSSKNQIFVTTHSTAFVDQADLQNTWIIRKVKKETRAFRMKEPGELKVILYELGLRPSDIFYANGIVFAEGQTEKVVLPTWSAKMGIDFDRLGISVVPTNGKASGKYHLTVWTDAAENTGIPYYLILDKDAQDEAGKLRAKLVPEENLFLLKKGAIEEYYPKERIIQAIEREYSIKLSEEDKRLDPPMDKSIEKLIRAKVRDPTGWKVAIGKAVAESMSLDEIDDEIKRIFERIRTKHEQIFSPYSILARFQ